MNFFFFCLFLKFFSWSRNGRMLISAATDNLVCIWDVTSGENLNAYRYPTPVMKVQFSPRDGNLALVCPLKPGPVLVKTLTNEQIILPELEKVSSKKKIFGINLDYLPF